MAKTTTKIFKKGSLDFKGPVRISNIQTEDSTAGRPNGHTELSANAKAIIVENHEDFSIIEVTCNCGKKLYLRCNYPQTIEKETAATQK
jgi:hypothetical protein